jgi:hypothetical protein
VTFVHRLGRINGCRFERPRLQPGRPTAPCSSEARKRSWPVAAGTSHASTARSPLRFVHPAMAFARRSLDDVARDRLDERARNRAADQIFMGQMGERTPVAHDDSLGVVR